MLFCFGFDLILWPHCDCVLSTAFPDYGDPFVDYDEWMYGSNCFTLTSKYTSNKIYTMLGNFVLLCWHWLKNIGLHRILNLSKKMKKSTNLGRILYEFFSDFMNLN